MGVLMLRCPMTDREFSSGIYIGHDEFQRLVNVATKTNCPHCGQPSDHTVNWVVRRKRAQLPRNADDRDRARFAKAQPYMVRRDDMVACGNIRCRKRFEITSLQTLAFL